VLFDQKGPRLLQNLSIIDSPIAVMKIGRLKVNMTPLREGAERRRVPYTVFECLDAAGDCCWQPSNSVVASETVYPFGER